MSYWRVKNQNLVNKSFVLKSYSLLFILLVFSVIFCMAWRMNSTVLHYIYVFFFSFSLKKPTEEHYFAKWVVLFLETCDYTCSRKPVIIEKPFLFFCFLFIKAVKGNIILLSVKEKKCCLPILRFGNKRHKYTVTFCTHFIYEHTRTIKNLFLLSVRISRYGYTRQVWRARKMRKSCMRQ